MQTTRTPYSISFMATVLLLLLFACHSTVANAAVALGATRVIYPANQKLVCSGSPTCWIYALCACHGGIS